MNPNDTSGLLDFSKWDNFVSNQSPLRPKLRPEPKTRPRRNKSYSRIFQNRQKPSLRHIPRNDLNSNLNPNPKRTSRPPLKKARASRKKTTNKTSLHATNNTFFQDPRLNTQTLTSEHQKHTKTHTLKRSMRAKKFQVFPNKFEEDKKRRQQYRQRQREIYHKYRIKTSRAPSKSSRSVSKRSTDTVSESRPGLSQRQVKKPPPKKTRPCSAYSRKKDTVLRSKQNCWDQSDVSFLQTVTGSPDPLIRWFSKTGNSKSRSRHSSISGDLVLSRTNQPPREHTESVCNRKSLKHFVDIEQALKSLPFEHKHTDHQVSQLGKPHQASQDRPGIFGKTTAELSPSPKYYFSISEESDRKLRSPMTPEFHQAKRQFQTVEDQRFYYAGTTQNVSTPVSGPLPKVSSRAQDKQDIHQGSITRTQTHRTRHPLKSTQNTILTSLPTLKQITQPQPKKTIVKYMSKEGRVAFLKIGKDMFLVEHSSGRLRPVESTVSGKENLASNFQDQGVKAFKGFDGLGDPPVLDSNQKFELSYEKYVKRQERKG